MTQLSTLDRAELTAWLTRVTQTIDRSLREPWRGEALLQLRDGLDGATASVPVLAQLALLDDCLRVVHLAIASPGSAGARSTPGGSAESINERFFLVDLPGYGYAEVSQSMRDSWRPLIESYLAERTSLAGVLLLIDIRRGAQDEELDFLPWLAERAMPVVVALTKADKLAKNKRTLEVGRVRQALGLRRDPLAVSALTGDGIEPLWRAVVQLVTARPAGTPGTR